jgi:hypothetical protein
MTTPDIRFVDNGGQGGLSDSTDLAPQPESPPESFNANAYPDPILAISEETRDKLLIWLDQWLQDLISEQSSRQTTWSKWESAYRGEPDATISSPPFKGASIDVIPVIAMAVDPIHARLDTGMFKQDPVFSVKPLRATMTKLAPSIEKFIDAYQKHKLQLRRVSSPHILGCTKLGTCVFKTVYDKEIHHAKTYDVEDNYKVVEKDMITFAGPRVLGVDIGDFLYPSGYLDVQDCPIVFERQRTTFEKLKVLEYSKKLANVDELKNQEKTSVRTELETARDTAAGRAVINRQFELEVYEAWCDYDIDGDGMPERLVITYHPDTRTILQLRYNWYFHQRKPYTVIPYSIANGTLDGIGIGEMAYPFQLAVTRFHRMASDNAYIANIRMFIAKRNSGIEEVPRLYSGRVFFVDDPTKDFIPFQAGDIYPSTIAERQNLFGMVEKRTGVNDYLTGRESPIVGSRATATSTLALIREGTQRVEEVLENFRNGFSEIVNNCISIWVQYGTGGIEDMFFEGDQIADDVKIFFKQATHDNVNGLIGVELTATDPTASRVQMQQMQLSIIQVMMQYLEKVLAAGQGALQAQQQMPQLTDMIKEVMRAARAMFLDLLKKYDIRNPDDYLPDLEKYLGNGTGAPEAAQPGAGPGIGGPAAGNAGVPALPAAPSAPVGPQVPGPATPGSGGAARVIAALAGAASGNG